MFEHQPETVLENNDYKLLWDYNIQTDHQISATRPDLVVISKQEQACRVIDIAVPEDTVAKAKEEEKLEKYQDLAREIQKMWIVRNQVVPVVIGALGTVPKRLESNLKRIGTNTYIELIKKKPLSLAQQEF